MRSPRSSSSSPRRITAGKYLRSWGLSPQKPVRRAYEQNPEAVARWLAEEYPKIQARAAKEQAVILWLDQTGLRSDCTVGRGRAPAGQAPVVPKTGKRFGINVMAAISNKGELFFTCYRGSFTGPVFLTYLQRLVRQLDRKIYLIVDRHPVHRRVSVRDWLAEHVDSIEMHLLPGYAPELNPVELLNGAVKRHVAQANPGTVAELTAAATAHLDAARTSHTSSKPCSASQKSDTPQPDHHTFALRVKYGYWTARAAASGRR
jgi:transposase